MEERPTREKASAPWLSRGPRLSIPGGRLRRWAYAVSTGRRSRRPRSVVARPARRGRPVRPSSRASRYVLWVQRAVPLPGRRQQPRAGVSDSSLRGAARSITRRRAFLAPAIEPASRGRRVECFRPAPARRPPRRRGGRSASSGCTVRRAILLTVYWKWRSSSRSHVRRRWARGCIADALARGFGCHEVLPSLKSSCDDHADPRGVLVNRRRGSRAPFAPGRDAAPRPAIPTSTLHTTPDL